MSAAALVPPPAGLRRVLADFGPLDAANGFIGAVFWGLVAGWTASALLERCDFT